MSPANAKLLHALMAERPAFLRMNIPLHARDESKWTMDTRCAVGVQQLLGAKQGRE